MQQFVIAGFQWSSHWGWACRGDYGHLQTILGWAAVALTCFSMLYFYYLLNKDTEWAAFLVFLVLDCGVSLVAVALLLLRPMDMVVPNRYKPDTSHHPTDAVATTETSALLNPLQELEVSSPNDDNSNSTTGVAIPAHDVAINIHALVFLLASISSIISDLTITYHQTHIWSWTMFVLDVVEDVFYCLGFLIMSVCYRLIASGLWDIQRLLEDASNDHNTQEESSILLSSLSHRYEAIFETTEKLNGRTSPLVVIIVAMTIMEMASSLHEFFSGNESFEWNLQSAAILRLLLVLGSLNLQVALSAADLVYASERIAEAASRREVVLRVQGNEHAVATAMICKAFGDRVRNHPARIRISWFHLTTEWALGLCLVVFSVWLAVIGIELPGGE